MPAIPQVQDDSAETPSATKDGARTQSPYKSNKIPTFKNGSEAELMPPPSIANELDLQRQQSGSKLAYTFSSKSMLRASQRGITFGGNDGSGGLGTLSSRAREGLQELISM